ncbi:Uncharacterised protein [uncultured Eubacterium sp.]|nr:Uncharacterised protein [uncultured Eubacterium sp.]
MKIILKDKTELEITMARISTSEKEGAIKMIISLDNELVSQHTVRDIQRMFTKDNISNIELNSEKGNENLTFTTLIDIMYILNDYEKKFDIILEQEA